MDKASSQILSPVNPHNNSWVGSLSLGKLFIFSVPRFLHRFWKH